MDKQRLQRMLADLESELRDSRAMDDDARELLHHAIRDIQSVIDADEVAPEHRDSLIAQLEEATLRFETEHPTLSMTLGGIMDALGKLGI